MVSVPADVFYRGYRIVWDTRQVSGTVFWTGKVAVVLPADDSGVRHVCRITESIYAASEEAARDCFIGLAKEWIDFDVSRRNSLSRQHE